MPIPATAPAAERRLLRDTVRERLRTAILEETLEPGEKLHDDELVRWLGVSRTPVREAIADLARAGLIEMSPNRFTRVAQPDAAEAPHALQALGVLHGGAVRLAVTALDASVHGSIGAGIDACLTEVARRDPSAFYARLAQLFEIFVAHCGNPSLQKVCGDATDGLTYRVRAPKSPVPLRWWTVEEALGALRAATLAGDAVAASQAADALHGLPAS